MLGDTHDIDSTAEATFPNAVHRSGANVMPHQATLFEQAVQRFAWMRQAHATLRPAPRQGRAKLHVVYDPREQKPVFFAIAPARINDIAPPRTTASWAQARMQPDRCGPHRLHPAPPDAG
jgi:hypothetical protein